MFKKFWPDYKNKLSLAVSLLAALSVSCFFLASFSGCNTFLLSKDSSQDRSIMAGVKSNILWPHEKSDLKPDHNVIFGRLPNGFRYVLMNNNRPAKRVSMHLDVQVGSAAETADQQGLAHFLEHLLFDGSTHFKPDELVKYFQNIGMSFGPDANAHTGFYETVYDILLPKGDKKDLENGLLVMEDFANGALLLPSQIEKERKIVLAEKRTRDSASYRSYVATMKFELPDSILSKRLPIGQKEILKKAGRKQLKDFYDTWYRPEKMILVMVGDFDTQLATSLIKKKFQPLSPRAPPETSNSFGKIYHKGIKPFYHYEKEAGHTTISIEVLKKVLKKPDSFAFQTKKLIHNVADQIVQQRLEAVTGKPKAPFTSASIGSGIYLRRVKYAEITADCSPENWNKTLSFIEQTLRKALKYGFTKNELERVKKDFLSDLDDRVKKAATRNSRDLARKIIRSINNDRVFMSPSQEKKLFQPVLKKLTLKQINDTFRKNWSVNHRLVLVTGNVKLDSPETSILKAYNNSVKIRVTKPVEKKSIHFPYLSEPEYSGKIVKRKNIPDLGIIQIDFENGIRLNLKKTDFKANQVLVNIAFGDGRSSEPANCPGLAALSTAVINESGLGSLEKDDIERALAGKNTGVTFKINEDRFLFKGVTVTNQVPLLIQLLYAHIVDPGYRKEAYNLSMERYRQKYRALSSSIDGAVALASRRFLAGGDTRFGLVGYDVFKQRTLNEVQSWINSSIHRGGLEISVVGDFDIDSTITSVEKYFGTLTFNSNTNDISLYPSIRFPSGKTLNLSVPTKIQKGIVIVAYPSESLWDISKTRRLSILADVISDRLREQIREKLGAAYSAFAFNRPSRAYFGYGVMEERAYVNPEESDMIVRQLKKISSALAENGATEEELQRALAPTLTKIKEMMQNNTYWLNTVLTGSKKHPRQLEWSRTILKDYASITKKDISNFAKIYLDNRKAATIVIKPD